MVVFDVICVVLIVNILLVLVFFDWLLILVDGLLGRVVIMLCVIWMFV